MSWLKTIFSQIKQDFHDARILAVAKFKKKFPLVLEDHEDEIQKQKENHILLMLRSQKLEDLRSDHEEEEAREAIKLYQKILKIRAKTMSMTKYSMWQLKVEKTLRQLREKDDVVEAIERVSNDPSSFYSFIYRMISYVLIGSCGSILIAEGIMKLCG